MDTVTAWDVPVVRWVAWPSDGALDLGFVDPLLRRRLSPLARGALHVANACAREHPSASFVFASRHGELQRTVELLRNLARDEEMSPTLFSLSVLNSAAGIFSIARNDHAPATAIAAGCESFGYGLLEAHLRATRNQAAPVVYVYADAPAPVPLGHQPGDPEAVFALGLLIDSSGTTQLHTEIELGKRDLAEPILQAAVCLQALQHGTGLWSGCHRNWRWSMR